MESERKGDADIAAVAAVLAEPARARIVQALDGCALPASVLAATVGRLVCLRGVSS